VARTKVIFFINDHNCFLFYKKAFWQHYTKLFIYSRKNNPYSRKRPCASKQTIISISSSRTNNFYQQ